MVSAVADTDASLLDADSVVRRFDTDAERGLSTGEAVRRLLEGGPNEIAAGPPVPRWRRFVEQFRNPLIYLLFVAIVISLVVWAVEGATGWPADAVVITAIVIANAVLGYVQRAHADRAVEALMQMSAATATVVRDGVQRRIPTRELVPGDVLVLAEGDTVAADARLLSASTLQVSEAPLTGESEPVLKHAQTLPAPAALADRLNMVFNGSAVNRGAGRAVVTATAMGTEIGQIVVLLRSVREEPTPLQREIARLGRTLGIAVLAIAVVVIAATLIVFGIDSLGNFVIALLLGVSLAVAAVPEGLPAIMSVVLALGVRRMAARNAIVKDLSSVETLGSASVVCSDKTGTLTTGEMTIGLIVTPVGEVAVTGAGYRPEGRLERDGVPLPQDSELGRQCALVVGIGSLANDATLVEQDGEWIVEGDPTEAAFLVAEEKATGGQGGSGRFRRVDEIPFTSERKLMSSVESDAEHSGRITVFTKGAPEVLLGHCSHIQVGDRVERLDNAWCTRIIGDVERLSSDAFRTLAVAYKRLASSAAPAIDESLERDLVYAGMVGIIDPPRPEAAAAIIEARRAGIRVVMITGDHPLTAARIARDLGLAAEQSAVSGADLAELSEERFRDTVRRRSVYARVSPADKQRIVDALHADHHIVAMTGDGVNDAPALKAADIGVAMGRGGTEVAKEAAKMILTDDNFATIVQAIREGRGIFSNIKKFLRYLLSSNMGEVLTVFLGVVLASTIGLSDGHSAVALPLLATQILWINLLTDSGPAMAMGLDRETEDLMNRPPRALSDRIIDGRMWEGIVVSGVVMALAALLTIDLYLPGGLLAGEQSLDNARTAGFTVLVFAQLFNSLSARSETGTAFRRLFANLWLWAAIAVAALLQVAVVHLPFLRQAFSTEALTAAQWLVCVAMASTVLWASEIRNWFSAFSRAAETGRRPPP